MRERWILEMFGSLELAEIERMTVSAVAKESKTRAAAAEKLGISLHMLKRRLKLYRMQRDPAELRAGLKAEDATRERVIQTSVTTLANALEDAGVAIDRGDDD